MIFIAHRGNLRGPNPKMENKTSYIRVALKEGFFVEIDIWFDRENWWSGHDKPRYKWDFGELHNHHQQIIFHAKNAAALEILILSNERYHCFWHNTDKYTLTSDGLIWVYPGEDLLEGSVCVLPENGFRGNIKACGGVCTDYPIKYLGKIGP